MHGRLQPLPETPSSSSPTGSQRPGRRPLSALPHPNRLHFCSQPQAPGAPARLATHRSLLLKVPSLPHLSVRPPGPVSRRPLTARVSRSCRQRAPLGEPGARAGAMGGLRGRSPAEAPGGRGREGAAGRRAAAGAQECEAEDLARGGAAFLLGFSEAPASQPKGFSSDRGWGFQARPKDTDRPLLGIFLSLHFWKNSTGGNSLSPPPFYLR